MPQARATRLLLVCGILAPLVFVGTDVLAGLLYPGYSFASQAVSELFAIDAPTSALVVPLFSLASILSLAFAFGVWRSGDRRMLRLAAVMFAGSAVNGLILWNFFPMHMRGVARTFTDTMHLALAVNPFVLLSLVFVVAAFRNWLRFYTVATIVVLIAVAGVSFSYAPALDANLPTPWVGLTERIAQWTYDVWQVVLAIVCIRALQRGFQSVKHPTIEYSPAAPTAPRSAIMPRP
jgi:hypothetical protein